MANDAKPALGLDTVQASLLGGCAKVFEVLQEGKLTKSAPTFSPWNSKVFNTLI